MSGGRGSTISGGDATRTFPQPTGDPRWLRVEHPPAGCPSLDAEVLAELECIGGDTDLVGELAQLFLADAGLQVASLGDALFRADASALSHTAHQLRGAAANVGASELARLCSLLPARGTPLDEPRTALVVTAIRSELDRVRAAFDEHASLR